MNFVLALGSTIHPYINLGIGEAVNKAYDYHEEPRASDAVPMMQPFADQTVHHFTYLTGLGFDVDITQHVRIGAG